MESCHQDGDAAMSLDSTLMDLQVHDITHIEIRNCENTGRQWRELRFLRGHMLILEVAVWAKEPGQLAELKLPA